MDFLKNIKYEILKTNSENFLNTKNYHEMQYDSRKIELNDIFVALTGAVVDGHDFIKNAYENGARCILVEKKENIDISFPITYIYVENLRKNLGLIASQFYNWPQNKLTIIGFTGTNGKTSSTYFLEKILGESNVARIGTIEYKVGKKIVEAQNTTPESLDIVKICRDAVLANEKYLIMEVSSHALELGRVDMLTFDVASFTNLTQDHLDFHHNMENYFQAKRKLFCKLKDKNNSVINIDDSYGQKLYAEFGGYSYGINSKTADITGKIKNIFPNGQEIEVNILGEKFDLNTKLLGKFNLYNLLGVIGVAKKLNIDNSHIIDIIKNLKGVPGRFELLHSKADFSVIVDYAHTDDSLDNVLNSINEIKNKESKVITVFGCGGDRDKTKRPKMGKIAELKSDFVFVTSDNPRTEDPNAIIEDITKGLIKNNHKIQVDRAQAISEAIQLAQKNDIVLIAGKGHETYQVIGRTKYHFDDREIAYREIVKHKLTK